MTLSPILTSCIRVVWIPLRHSRRWYMAKEARVRQL